MVAGTAKQGLKRALVVGGQESFVRKKLSKSLERHGIVIHTHLSWTRSRPPAKLPKGIDLVYICTDMVGHGLSVPCMDYARDLGIPYVNGTRKWAESLERLTQAGFPLLNPAVDLQNIIEEVIATRPPGTPPTQQDLRGVVVAITGNVKTADKMLAPDYDPKTGSIATPAIPISNPTSVVISAALPAIAPTPEPAKEAPMAVIPESRKETLGIYNPKQRAYIAALVANPLAMNKEIWEAVSKLPLFTGSKQDPQRIAIARDQLGIVITRSNGNRTTDIDLEKFMETAEALKLKYTLPEARYVQDDSALPGSKAVPQTDGVKTIDQANVLELLAALRAAMTKEHYVELHLTEAGISYKRVEVTEGTFTM